jgi:hypothetical protein
MRADYGSDHHLSCKVNALVKPGAGAWLTGVILPDEANATKPIDDKASAADSKPVKPQAIKIRRQGESLRIVLVVDGDDPNGDRSDCDYLWQITSSYFASGKGTARLIKPTPRSSRRPSTARSRRRRAMKRFAPILISPTTIEN